MTVDLRQASFLKSVVSPAGLAPASGREVAFAGRSNAGKSSALNAITGVRGLARVSRTPGRTQCINFFSVSEACYLVDLPGYGYARAPAAVQRRWSRLMEAYFTARSALAGLVLVMDIRRPVREFDVEFLAWTEPLQMPALVLLSKADKLSRAQTLAVQRQVQRQLQDRAQVQIFSAANKSGVDNARHVVAGWFLNP